MAIHVCKDHHWLKKKKLVFTDCPEILQIRKETVRGQTMQYDSVMKMNCLAYMLQHEQNS